MKALILALLMAGAAAAQDKPLNYEQWIALPDEAQFRYVAHCADDLAATIAKEDPAEAQMIRRYFIDKQPGKPFSEGMAKTLDGLGMLIRFKKSYPLVDLSSVEVCTVVLQTLVGKFGEYERLHPQHGKK